MGPRSARVAAACAAAAIAATAACGQGYDFGEDFCADLAHVDQRARADRYLGTSDLVSDLRAMTAPAAVDEAFAGVVGGYDRLARRERGDGGAGTAPRDDEAASFSAATDELAAYARSACHLDIGAGIGTGADDGTTPG